MVDIVLLQDHKHCFILGKALEGHSDHLATWISFLIPKSRFLELLYGKEQ